MVMVVNNAIEIVVYDPPQIESPQRMQKFSNSNKSKPLSLVTPPPSSEIQEEYVKSYFFASFLGRDAAYETMQTLWRLQKNAAADYSSNHPPQIEMSMPTNRDENWSIKGTTSLVDILPTGDVDEEVMDTVSPYSSPSNELKRENSTKPPTTPSNPTEGFPSSGPGSVPHKAKERKSLPTHSQSTTGNKSHKPPVISAHSSSSKITEINHKPAIQVSGMTALWLLLVVCMAMVLSSFVVLLRVGRVVYYLEDALPVSD